MGTAPLSRAGGRPDRCAGYALDRLTDSSRILIAYDQRVFTRPDDLDDAAIVGHLSTLWGTAVDEIEYQAVGFGSHHWLARRGPEAWFVTVDDLDTRLLDDDDHRVAAQTRLTAALTTVRALRDVGHTWVVAPIRSLGGKVIEAIDERFVCALYPFVAGRTSSWGAFEDAEQRRAVVELLIELHRADPEGQLPALSDDQVIPRRDTLEEAMNDTDLTWTGGPFAESARTLLAQHLHPVAAVLERYDELAETVSHRASPVVTHGEPHRGNVIVTEAGPALIDWDTTRLAPRERDLWNLIVEDPAIRQFYEARAGTTLDDSALRLYELWWDLCEIALFIHDFRQPHSRHHNRLERTQYPPRPIPVA